MPGDNVPGRNDIAGEFLELVSGIESRLELPAIRSIHMAETDQPRGRSSKFGAVVLTDDTVGLTFVDLDDSRSAIAVKLDPGEFIDRSPIHLARLYGKSQAWQRAAGFSAINAISQFLLRHSGLELPPSPSTLDMLSLADDDRVGMVGYFPPLVRAIVNAGTPLTVVELDPAWLDQEQPGVELTPDPSRLSGCNKVLITGTTLINHTLDGILEHCRHAREIIVLGPTTSCLPDPLFTRGVTVVAGRQVTDCQRFLQFREAGEPWREVANRYLFRRGQYPGWESLLRSCDAH